jgi:chloride channel protein, CIC family
MANVPPLSRRTPTLQTRFSRLLSGAGGGPLDLQILGRVLLHAALVGIAAGGLGTLFVFGCEMLSALLLGYVAGYHPLHAAGEHDFFPVSSTMFRPWLLLFVPAAGALVSGVLCYKFAPEAFGGGTDALIDAFHHKRGVLRKRVPIVKLIASAFTLGAGGSGGREGPTMLIGGAVGSLVARALRVTERERRILLVAGTAAGMSAVFRTPLGAALLAVEVLHRDDFESDALVPSVLASVVGYSVSIAFLGESALFAHSEHFPFVPLHLPLYLLQAILVCAFASLFLVIMDVAKRIFARPQVPVWLRPAIGGLLLGCLAVPIVILLDPYTGRAGQGVGVLTGGYGAVQVAVQGSAWLPLGWRAVEFLMLMAVLKMVATALTVGSGGSAGDFGPSLVIGGLLGGAFGRAASLVVGDGRIDPGAFALVGMATFYGGIAHVPLAALVMTCELAGSYELLVPLMLSEGVAFVLLRNRALYKKQLPTKRDSPAHRKEMLFDVLREVKVGAVVSLRDDYVTFVRSTPAREVVRNVAMADWQDTFPVLADDGALLGLITAEVLRVSTTDPEFVDIALADDLMSPAVFLRVDEDLHEALERLLEQGLRELPVLDETGKIVGFLDEAEVTRAYHAATLES